MNTLNKNLLIPKSVFVVVFLAVIFNVFRISFFDSGHFVYMLWNIFLASIPLVISSFVLWFLRKDKLSPFLLLILSISWLLFLPNAPYLVTDFIHLGENHRAPFTYDLLLFSISALAGLVLICCSLLQMEKMIEVKFSQKVALFFSPATLLITSFGIYVGRFLRFNSWDVFVVPGTFIKEIGYIFNQPADYVNEYVFIGLFFVLLLVSYKIWKYMYCKNHNANLTLPIFKKIIAFDMDGTLTKSKQPLESDMAQILVALLEIKKVVIVSGGSIKQFKEQFLAYLDHSKSASEIIYRNLILLPVNGSQRYEYNNAENEWQITDQVLFPEEMRDKTIKALETIILSGDYGVPPIPEGEYIEDRHTQITFSALGQKAPIEKKITWDPDQKKRQKIKAQLEKEIPEVEIAIGGTTSIDILPKGFDKAHGLERLLEKLEIKKNEMVFVGDAIFPGGNDYSPYLAGIECVKVSDPKETAQIIAGWLSA